MAGENIIEIVKEKSMGDKIQAARRLMQYTQSVLALRSGVPQAEISKFENDRQTPSLDTLQKLAEGLGMDLVIDFVPQQKKDAADAEQEDNSATDKVS